MDPLLRSALPLSVNLNRYATKVATHIKLPSTLAANSGGWFGLEARLCSCHVEHHSNHDADAWSIQMSDEEEPAPSTPVSDNDDNDDVASHSEKASMAQKRRKTGITKCKDEYAVSQRRQALSTKANTCKFLGLRAKNPAIPNSAKTAKHSGKDFVNGVLFVTLVAFGAKKPLNRTAQWFSCCTLDCKFFLISQAQMGKIARKRQCTDICGSTLVPRTRITDALSKTSRPNASQRLLLEASNSLAARRGTIRF